VSALRAELTVTLRPTGPGEGAGTLTGHPATPTVRTRRAGDRLQLQILHADRRIGGGALALHLSDPGEWIWAGEIQVDGCRWWALSPFGTGIVTFSHPRPRRGVA
jgi:hypothetical protein